MPFLSYLKGSSLRQPPPKTSAVGFKFLSLGLRRYIKQPCHTTSARPDKWLYSGRLIGHLLYTTNVLCFPNLHIDLFHEAKQLLCPFPCPVRNPQGPDLKHSIHLINVTEALITSMKVTCSCEKSSLMHGGLPIRTEELHSSQTMPL